MRVSFIVPVKDQLAYTRGFVESVHRQNPGAEVEWVIVDSGSADGTLHYCAGIGARVVPFRSQPFNYCAAVNAGAEAASGDLWIIANNDLEFCSPGDLARLTTAFREWPLLAVVSPGRAEGESELEFRLGGINGATWAVRPEAFRAWGGMPESMSGYGYDEAYTAFQCWRRGYGLAWLTGWEVLHFGSVTFGPLGGNVTPAQRRNLSRLLAAMEAAELDSGRAADYILDQLRRRERMRAPVRLIIPAMDDGTLERQGYANARPRDQVLNVPTDVPWVHGATRDVERRQWLPWLANELLLQPEARVVGADGWYAVRPVQGHAAEAGPELQALLRTARVVGPPAPTMMPHIPERRPTLRQRLFAFVHDWRNRTIRLPEGW